MSKGPSTMEELARRYAGAVVECLKANDVSIPRSLPDFLLSKIEAELLEDESNPNATPSLQTVTDAMKQAGLIGTNEEVLAKLQKVVDDPSPPQTELFLKGLRPKPPLMTPAQINGIATHRAKGFAAEVIKFIREDLRQPVPPALTSSLENIIAGDLEKKIGTLPGAMPSFTLIGQLLHEAGVRISADDVTALGRRLDEFAADLQNKPSLAVII